MPTPLKSLIEYREKRPSIPENEMVTLAMNIMIEHDISELAVINEENEITGMVSYKSIMHASKNFGVSLDRLHISHAKVKIDTFNNEDDLFDALESLQRKAAIAVIDDENKFLDLLIIDDAMLFYRRRAEDFMFVEDIESMIKEMIGFSRDIEEIKNFERLSLFKYVELLLSPEHWDFYKSVFKLEPDEIHNLLNDVRKIRNGLAHFQGELTAEERSKLRFCTDWLTPKYSKLQIEFETSQDQENNTLTKQRLTREQIREYMDRVSPAIIQEYNNSKYAPLANFLLSQQGKTDSFRISFEEIENIIGTELPKSAYTHRAWWANDANSHVQAKAWLDAGWRVGYRNMSGQEMNFTRIKERERAYIDFFGPLIKRLRDETDLPIKNSSPDGTSWITLISLPEVGRKHASINLSFALGKRFRIELYIDTENQEKNKAIFDTLMNQQTEIGKELGHPLVTWERLDDKRASRIALYRKGSITDGIADLAFLEDWIFSRVQLFYNAIYELANKAIIEHTD